MLEQDASRIGRLIADVQAKLRDEMLEQLVDSEEELAALLEPGSYSHALEEIRDKYIDRLLALQGVLHELANLDEGHRRRRTKATSLSADSPQGLTRSLNKKLRELEGCSILDVNFLKGNEKEWVAFITYLANPFDRGRQEQMQDQDRE